MLLDGYRTVIHLLSPLTLSLSLLGLYLIQTESRQMEKHSKRLLFYYQVLCLLMELYFSIFDLYYFPAPIPVAVTVFTVIPFVPGPIRLAIGFCFYCCTITMLFWIFFLRLQTFIVTDMLWLKLSRNRFRIVNISLFSGFTIPVFLLTFLMTNENLSNYDRILQAYPQYTTYLEHNRDRLLYYNPGPILSIALSYLIFCCTLGAFLLSLLFLASYKAISVQRFVSPKTKAFQRKFLIGLIIQTIVPITILALPSLFMCLVILLGFDGYSDVVNFEVVLSAFHGSSNTLMMLLMSENARKGAVELLSFGFWKRSKNSVSVVQSQATDRTSRA